MSAPAIMLWFMSKSSSAQMLYPGQFVEVQHLQGTEIGEISSINYKTGKALIFFDYEQCPHFDSFNITQLKKIKPKLAGS
jgi:hypothetical protein